MNEENTLDDFESEDPEPDFFKDLSQEARDYVDFLEEELEISIAQVESARSAVETFVEILAFIRENFGETADFPVRIDSDFYREVFLKKLEDCYGHLDNLKENKSSFED